MAKVEVARDRHPRSGVYVKHNYMKLSKSSMYPEDIDDMDTLINIEDVCGDTLQVGTVNAEAKRLRPNGLLVLEVIAGSVDNETVDVEDAVTMVLLDAQGVKSLRAALDRIVPE